MNSQVSGQCSHAILDWQLIFSQTQCRVTSLVCTVSILLVRGDHYVGDCYLVRVLTSLACIDSFEGRRNIYVFWCYICMHFDFWSKPLNLKVCASLFFKTTCCWVYLYIKHVWILETCVCTCMNKYKITVIVFIIILFMQSTPNLHVEVTANFWTQL